MILLWDDELFGPKIFDVTSKIGQSQALQYCKFWLTSYYVVMIQTVRIQIARRPQTSMLFKDIL